MKPAYRVTLISLLCLLLTLFSLGFGEISLSPAETCHYLYLALTSPEGNGMVEQDVLQFIRLPHLVLSFFHRGGARRLRGSDAGRDEESAGRSVSFGDFLWRKSGCGAGDRTRYRDDWEL